MLRQAVALSLALGILRGPGCGDVDSPSNGPNAPCTRDRDCREPLVCAQGVCVTADSGAGADDAGPGDSGHPSALDAGGDG